MLLLTLSEGVSPKKAPKNTHKHTHTPGTSLMSTLKRTPLKASKVKFSNISSCYINGIQLLRDYRSLSHSWHAPPHHLGIPLHSTPSTGGYATAKLASWHSKKCTRPLPPHHRWGAFDDSERAAAAPAAAAAFGLALLLVVGRGGCVAALVYERADLRRKSSGIVVVVVVIPRLD